MTKEELKARAVGFLVSKGKTEFEARRYFEAIWDQHINEVMRIPTIVHRLGLDRARIPQ